MSVSGGCLVKSFTSGALRVPPPAQIDRLTRFGGPCYGLGLGHSPSSRGKDEPGLAVAESREDP